MKLTSQKKMRRLLFFLGIFRLSYVNLLDMNTNHPLKKKNGGLNACTQRSLIPWWLLDGYRIPRASKWLAGGFKANICGLDLLKMYGKRPIIPNYCFNGDLPWYKGKKTHLKQIQVGENTCFKHDLST